MSDRVSSDDFLRRKDAVKKGWTKYLDREIVREAASKGVFSQLARDVIAERRGMETTEVNLWFDAEVRSWVIQLCTEGQVFKAVEILKNNQMDSTNEFLSIALAARDKTIRDNIANYLSRTINSVSDGSLETVNDFLLHWNLLRLLENALSDGDDYMIKEFKNEKETIIVTAAECRNFSIDKIKIQPLDWKSLVATGLFYSTLDFSIASLVNQNDSWEYLINNDNVEYLKQWIDYAYSNHLDPESEDKILSEMYTTWEITDEMLSKISTLKCHEYTRLSLIDHLANYGYFMEKDKSNLENILARFARNKNVNKIEDILNNKLAVVNMNEFTQLLTNFCVKNKYFHILAECVDTKYLTADTLNQKSDMVTLWMSINKMCANADDSKNVLRCLIQTINQLSNDPVKYLQLKPMSLLGLVLFTESDFLTQLKSDLKVGNISINKKHIAKILQTLPQLNNFITNMKYKKLFNDYPDITIYQLLNTYKHLDIHTVFQFQTSKQTDVATFMPHFNNDVLVSKYGHREKLTFAHYLKQCRPCYASKFFFMDQLKQYGKISQRQQKYAANIAHGIALKNFTKNEITCSCISFIEIIGRRSTILKCHLTAFNTILKYLLETKSEQSYEDCKSEVDSLIDKLFTDKETVVPVILRKLEDSASKHNDKPLQDIISVWENVITFCRIHKINLPESFLLHCGSMGNWLSFVIFIETFNYPLTQVLLLCEQFNNKIIMGHLLHALKYETIQVIVSPATPIKNKAFRNSLYSKIGVAPDNQESQTPESEVTICSETSADKQESEKEIESNIPYFEDIWATLLFVSDRNASHTLLEMSSRAGSPTLALLASCYGNDSIFSCWFAWLSISMGYKSVKSFSNILLHDVFEILRFAVQNGFVCTLHESVQIFISDSPLYHLTNFLDQTVTHLNFTSKSTNMLKKLKKHINTLEQSHLHPFGKIYDFSFLNNKQWILNNSLKLLSIALSSQFYSMWHQKQFLKCLCDSKISDDFKNMPNCSALIKMLNILSNTNVRLNLENICSRNSITEKETEYEKCLESLIAQKHFDEALTFAKINRMSTEKVVIATLKNKCDNFIENKGIDLNIWWHCDETFKNCNIDSGTAVNFLQIYSSKLHNYKLKYEIHRLIDYWMERGSYSSEDIEINELQMWINYLNIDDPSDCKIHHSKKYDTSKQPNLLNTLIVDLKTDAGIDALNTIDYKINDEQKNNLNNLMKMLLNIGDFVQALRLQNIFNFAQKDLQLIVTCMAIAEGQIPELAENLRSKLISSELMKSANAQFGKRTIRARRDTAGSNLSQSPTASANTTAAAAMNSVMNEYIEIPSREKQLKVDALEGMAARLLSGRHAGQRIVMVFRAAMYMDIEYKDVIIHTNVLDLLKKAIEDDCLNKLVVANDLMMAGRLSAKEIAEFLAHEIATTVISSNLPKNIMDKPRNNFYMLWGYNMSSDFHLFLELCNEPSLLGNYLIEYVFNIQQYKKHTGRQDEVLLGQLEDINNENTSLNYYDELGETSAACKQQVKINIKTILNNKKLNQKQINSISVELLIRAHDCFSQDCNMEGISTVLKKCRLLCAQLVQTKCWTLMVKLLIGIARYSEMTYIFELLKSNDQFECLLGQLDSILSQQESKLSQFRLSLLEFLKFYCPGDLDIYRMAALHFLMFSEVAKLWENEGADIVNNLIKIAKMEMANKGITIVNDNINTRNEHPPSILLSNSEDTRRSLNMAMNCYAHSAEYYLLDNKLTQATKAAHDAELIALQISLVGFSNSLSTDNTAYCILNLERSHITYMITKEFSVTQALILSRAYSHPSDWGSALYHHVVLGGNSEYLQEFRKHFEISVSLAQDLAKRFQKDSNLTRQMAISMRSIIIHVNSVATRYRLASELGFRDIIQDILTSGSLGYLKDTTFVGKHL